MTSINIPRDDAATKIDTKAVADRTVKQVAPYSSTQAVKGHEDATQTPPRQARKQTEQRKKDRRQLGVPVILDTRSGHDRRNVAAQKDVEVEDENTLPGKTGVDIYT